MDKILNALKLAEEALEIAVSEPNWFMDYRKFALAVIREALADHVEQSLAMVANHSGDANEKVAEPVKQKPVAWCCRYCNTDMPTKHASDCPIEICGLPNTYAAPVKREWVDLTDDEILKALGAESYDEYSERELANAVLDARAVIATFKEKNK